MGDARTTTVANITTRFNYELRNTQAVQWEAAETLNYINKWLSFIYMILVEHESDLVINTTPGSFVTVVGTPTYDLSTNSMGDLLVPIHVWLDGLAELEKAEESDSMAHVISKEQGNTSYSQPSSYYIEGDNMGLLPFPDDIYTVKVKYIPDYTELTLTTESIPYKNLFNNVLVEGVKVIAKNREGYGTAVDAALMELFQDRAMSILRKRQKQNASLYV